MKQARLIAFIAVLLAPSIANASERQCMRIVRDNLYKQGYVVPYNSGDYRTLSPMYSKSEYVTQYYFKWNPKDPWTPCNLDHTKLSCGSIATLNTPDTRFTTPTVNIFSTSGESFQAFQQGSKIMKCSIRPNPRMEGKGLIFTWDYSVIDFYKFTARSIGARTFFLRNDILGVETPVLLGKPKF